MAKQLVTTGLPCSSDKSIQRWEDYRDMQDAGEETKEFKRSERSRKPPQRYGTGYSRNSTFFPKEPENFNDGMKSNEKENWTEGMLELKSLEGTKT